ncbi:MAG TPA: GNAT family N-acetyltransferase [Sporolactobacillaceae bacterium]|nr:GNAT family N-acetyltransferase [Sporolactobacillaceae bacterium]
MEQTLWKFRDLETERFLLRKMTINDAGDMFDYFSNDEVTKYYDLDTFTSISQAVELIERMNERLDSGTGIRWGIIVKETNRLIGSCGYHSIEIEHLKAEIGYEINPAYWGRGVMTEILPAVVEFAFNEMHLNRIEAMFHPDNIGSKKVLKKVGFQQEGILRERYFHKQSLTDIIIVSLLKREWKPSFL